MPLALIPQHFDNIIRFANTCSRDRGMALRSVTFAKLRKLGVPRNPSKAVSGIPNGSDQLSMKSITDWVDKIEVENKNAVKQLIAIDATLFVRTKRKA